MRIQILILGFKGLNHAYKPVRIHSLLAANDLEWFENQPLRILTVPINKYHQLKWYKSLWLWRCRNVSHCQQQSYSGLCSHGRSCSTLILLKWNDSWVQSCHKRIRAKPTMNLRFQLLFSHIVWFEYDSECQVPLGLRSNRFQSSYGAKVRAGAKKNKVEVGEEGEKRTFFKIVEFAGKRFLISPPCPLSFLYFFAVVPTFLG